MDEPEPHHTATPDQGEPITDHVTPDMLNPNRRLTIDHVVYQWTLQQQAKDKVVTPNTVRQKAFEIGQQYDPNFKASLNWYNNWKKRFDYQESPEVEALKRKKKSYTAAFKLFAVQRVMELDSISQASLELNVSRRCLQRWKEELDVITTVAEQASNAVYRRPGQGRKVTDTSLDLQLLDWVDGKWKEGVTVTSVMVRQRARELSENPEFKASLGWFVKWQKRHNVDLKEKTIYSPMQHETQETPLKLRLLPEGQAATYTDRPRTTKKRKREYDEVVLQESDEEFDRLLLTWLVERWEVGETVTDKLLREKAAEISPSADFHPSKGWVALWKQKYNVSLESQTYGNAGEAEGEIVEETPVYDEVTIHEGNPLTPTKEEAATTLASLAADEHGVNIGAREGAEVMDVPNASGLEIAEALQKLASAFGLTQGSTKEAIAQLTAVPQASAGAHFLLEGGDVGAEEVVSEEVVTDEPVLVLDGGGMASTIPSTSTTLTHTQSPSSPPVSAPLVTTSTGTALLMEPSTVTSSSSSTFTSATDCTLLLTPSTVAQLLVESLSSTNQPVVERAGPLTPPSSTSRTTTSAGSVIEATPISLPEGSIATEEVVISEPLIEAFTHDPTITLDENQVMVLMEGGTILPPSSTLPSSFPSSIAQPGSVVTSSSTTIAAEGLPLTWTAGPAPWEGGEDSEIPPAGQTHTPTTQ